MATKRLLLVDDWPGLSPICGSGLGSSLFKLAAAEDARRHGREVDLLTSRPKKELLAHASTFGRLFDDPAQVSFDAYDRIGLLGLERPDPLGAWLTVCGDLRARGAVKRDYDQLPHLAYWRRLVAELAGYEVPASAARFPLGVSAEERTWAEERFARARPLVTLAVSALTHLKRYPHWPDAVEAVLRARPDATVALVGHSPHLDRLPEGCVDLTDRTSLTRLVALVERSDVVLGTDGLVPNLGLALQRPTVALFTIIQPEFVIDPHQAQRGPFRALTEPGCPLQFCYSRLGDYRTAPCPAAPLPADAASPRCTRVSPQRVAAAALSLLPPRRR